MKQFIEHLTGRVVLMNNEYDQSRDFPHTHSIRLPAQESHKHETTKLLNFTVSSTRCPAPASANAPGHGSLRAPLQRVRHAPLATDQPSAPLAASPVTP